jgi:hypothetical protein
MRDLGVSEVLAAGVPWSFRRRSFDPTRRSRSAVIENDLHHPPCRSGVSTLRVQTATCRHSCYF